MRMPTGRTFVVVAALALTSAAAGCGGSSLPFTGPNGNVSLQAVPDGVVTLGPGKPLQVTVSLFGLKSGATVTLSLQHGTCLSPGDAVVTFSQTRVEGNGTVRQTLTSSSTASVPTPASISLDQHEAGSNASAVGCTDLPKGQANLSQRMFPIPTARGGGTATLATDRTSGKVTVGVSAVGVVGTGPHSVELRLGTCDAVGSLVLDLGTVSVAIGGNAKATLSGQLPSATARKHWMVMMLSGRAGAPSSSNSGGAGPLRPLLCGDLPATASG